VSIIPNISARQHYDVIIVGAGISGLAAALYFALEGYIVLSVDHLPVHDISLPKGGWGDKRSTDNSRTVAILGKSVQFLRKLGIDIAKDVHGATPVNGLHLYESGDYKSICKGTLQKAAFYPNHQGVFGYHVHNSQLYTSMLRLVLQNDMITLLDNTSITYQQCQSERVIVGLSNGKHVSSRLIVAADGRSSITRDRLGITTWLKTFNQSVALCTVRHHEPHNNIVSEIYESGGPLTFIPSGISNYHSSIVWVDVVRHIKRLSCMNDPDFCDALEKRSGNLYSGLNLVSPRNYLFSLFVMLARSVIGVRSVLIAESAHVFPPVGAQGLNMSLRDIDALSILTSKKDDDSDHDIGSQKLLLRYQQNRKQAIVPMMMMINAMNYMSGRSGIIASSLRSTCLKIAAKLHKEGILLHK